MRKHFFALKKSLKVESSQISQVQVCLNISFGALQMHLALHRLSFSLCVCCGATELCLLLRKGHVSLLHLLIACVMYSALSSVIACHVFIHTLMVTRNVPSRVTGSGSGQIKAFPDGRTS